MLIGMSGFKGSGKDTVGAYLVKEHGFERRAFGDKIKQSVAALMDIPYEAIEKWKNEPDVCVTIHDTEVPGSCYAQQTFRSFLQKFGTESHRDVFGDDFWVNALLPVGGFYAGRAIVITDCRFKNEFERIKTLGGFVVRVDRFQNPWEAHRSELEFLDWVPDMILKNNGTTEQLFIAVETMLSELGVLSYNDG